MATISNFYKRLRDLCEERNMTVNELVKVLDLSSGSPTAWKNGAIPRNTTLDKIADYFGVDIDYLLGENKYRAVPLFEGLGGPVATSGQSKKAPTLTEKDRRNNMNVLRIAGRDGSYRERLLTDEQMAALEAILDQMPEAPEDL